MTRYLIVAIVALLVALGASGWFHIQQAKTAGELGQQLSAARAEGAAAKKAARRADAATAKARQDRDKADTAAKAVSRAVEAAIAAEPTWGTTPIPQSILEALNADADHSTLGGLGRLLDAARQPAPGSPDGGLPGAPGEPEDKRGPTELGPRSEAGPQEVQH